MHTQATDYHDAAINQPSMDRISSHSSCPANRVPSINPAIRLGHLRKHPEQPPQEHILALLQPLLDVIDGCFHLAFSGGGNWSLVPTSSAPVSNALSEDMTSCLAFNLCPCVARHAAAADGNLMVLDHVSRQCVIFRVAPNKSILSFIESL